MSRTFPDVAAATVVARVAAMMPHAPRDDQREHQGRLHS
jgi:hypothetical protein